MKTLILFFSLLLMVQAEITLDSSGLNSSIKKTTDNAYKSIRERKKRAAEERGRRERAANHRSGVYITDWGYDFSGDDRLWGRNGIKLSNGQEIYTWLSRQSYGSHCYQLFVQGAFLGNGSNCSKRINNNWSASCGNEQFWVQGDQTDVVKAIVGRCAR